MSEKDIDDKRLSNDGDDFEDGLMDDADGLMESEGFDGSEAEDSDSFEEDSLEEDGFEEFDDDLGDDDLEEDDLDDDDLEEDDFDDIEEDDIDDPEEDDIDDPEEDDIDEDGNPVDGTKDLAEERGDAEEQKEDVAKSSDVDPAGNKNKIILAVIGCSFVGALSFVGYQINSVLNPSVVQSQSVNANPGAGSSSALTSVDTKKLSENSQKLPSNSNSPMSSRSVEPDSQDSVDALLGELGANDNNGEMASASQSGNGESPTSYQPVQTVDFGLNEPLKGDSEKEIAQTKSVQKEGSHLNVDPQLGEKKIRSLMKSVIDESGLVTQQDIEDRISKISIKANGQEIDPDAIKESLAEDIRRNVGKLNASVEKQTELFETRIESIQGELESLTSIVQSLQDRQELLKAEQAEIEKAALKAEKSVEKVLSEKAPEKVTKPSKKVAPKEAFSLADLHGRERLPGFKIVGTESGGKVALTSAPSGKVFRFFKGEHMVIKGVGTFTVKDVLKDGEVLLVGDRFFVDTTYTSKPTKHSSSGNASTNESSAKKRDPSVESKDYVIAPTRPGSAKRSLNKEPSPSLYEQRARRGTGNAPDGWTFNGGRVDQSQFLIRKPNGKWGIVRIGDQTEIGQVKGLSQSGDLIIGNYTLTSR